MRRVLGLLLTICFLVACHSPIQQASVEPVLSSDAVSITDVRFPSKSIGGILWYRIVIPKVGPGGPLPVLYLLHGANSSPVEMMERSDIAKLASLQHLIVVMPEAGLSYYTNAAHKGSARWEDAITQELPHDVETRFALLKGREHRGIAGISMGGYGAVKLALKHPELYGFAGSLSGAFDITRRPASAKRWGQTWRIWTIFGVTPSARQEEDVFDLLARDSKVQNTVWFQSCGEHDPLRSINARFARELRERGAHLESINTAGGHDWQSWSSAMPQLFTAARKNLQ